MLFLSASQIEATIYIWSYNYPLHAMWSFFSSKDLDVRYSWLLLVVAESMISEMILITYVICVLIENILNLENLFIISLIFEL